MTQIRRRKTLQLSAASALAAGAGGLAGILASGRAPAYAQTQTMHWLRWADFVPSSDVLLKGEITKLCDKDLGMKLTVETINANDIQARITAAIQSGAGPDIFMTLNNWPQLYADSCSDVSDVAEDLGKAQGGFYDICTTVGTVGGKWIGVPWCTGGGLVAYRKSWLAEAGATEFPKNWDDYRTVGKKLKAAGRPYGQTAGHTFGDAPGWWYPYLWSWGGKEVEADGKTVVLNSKATIESVKFATGFWKDAFDDGGMSWDDAGNNRAYLANTISSTSNGASIYLLAKAKPDTYMTETGKPLKDDCFHSPLPSGPAGQFSWHVPFSNLVPSYGKNQKAAKDFLRWFHSTEVYDTWFTSQQGFSVGVTKAWENHKLWNDDPVMAPFRTAAESGLFAGYAGPAGPAAAETISKFIIVDMYAKAVQGMPAEEAVKWAHSELLKIYG